MPVQPTYPGVYVEELSSGVHTITGVATSITAFIGRALRGPVNEPVTINSYAEFERTFGPLWLESSLGYAVRDFYLNGGSKAIIVRLFHQPTDAERKQESEAAVKVFKAFGEQNPAPANPTQTIAAIAAMEGKANEYSGRAARVAKFIVDAAKDVAKNPPTPASVTNAAQSVADALIGAAFTVAYTSVSDSAEPKDLKAAMEQRAKDFKGEPEQEAAANIVLTAAKAVKDTKTKEEVAQAAKDSAKKIADTVAEVIKAQPATQPSTTATQPATQPSTTATQPATQPSTTATQPATQPSTTATPSDAQTLASKMRTAADGYKSDPYYAVADPIATAAEKEANLIERIKQAVKPIVDEQDKPPSAHAKILLADLPLEAAFEGIWGRNLRASIDFDVQDEVAENMGLKQDELFNLTITDTSPGGSIERLRNLSFKRSIHRIDKVLEAESHLVHWIKNGDIPDTDDLPFTVVSLKPASNGHNGSKPNGKITIDDDVTKAEGKLKEAEKKRRAAKLGDNGKTLTEEAKRSLEDAKNKMEGDDGVAISASDFTGTDEALKMGLYALEEVDLFNMLCIPPYGDKDVDIEVISAAAAYCEKRRAILIVDPPSGWKDKTTAIKEFMDSEDKIGTRSRNAALFFPRLKQANPLRSNQVEEFVPCGAVAGVIARTDTERGVWKAPAGIEASLKGVRQLSVNLTDAENGELNPLGINCLRSFPIYGPVVWGARTLHGADQFADEYKYLPVRRLALYIEESLYRGLKWVVFEPNDEPLWAQIRLNAGAFMHNLFRQGAFQGQTPREAYLVKCDRETTTQNDINLGIVNILIAFAPLKPAEFVIIKLQQLAGQIEV